MSKSPASLLNRAATLIEKRGWTREVYQDDRGRLCALGALGQADGVDIENFVVGVGSPAFRRANVALGDALDEDITDWNDRQKSKRAVVATLRRVARSLQKRQSANREGE